MPQAVWSQSFIVYTSEAPNTLFEVPAGYTAVIRQVTAYDPLGATSGTVSISSSEIAPLVVVAWFNIESLNSGSAMELRAVVPEGGFIKMDSTSFGSGAQIYVGGYLLRNTPQ